MTSDAALAGRAVSARTGPNGFGPNALARSLPERFGYEITRQNMAKQLD